MRVGDKVAIVTGGASGIGEAIAELLAEEGAKVVVADIDDAAGAAVVERIRARGQQAHYVRLDVTREEDWANAMRVTLERYGKLTTLVNNAGIAPQGDVEHTSYADWKRIVAVNLDGVFLGTQLAIRTIRQCQVPGSIINMSSTEGIRGNAKGSAYNASKAGVRVFTKSAALYCASEKLPIRVNSVHPGGIMTPLVEKHFTEVRPQDLASFVAEHPIGHLGEPRDIAYGVLYLASDESKFMLGAELVIDGGLTAG